MAFIFMLLADVVTAQLIARFRTLSKALLQKMGRAIAASGRSNSEKSPNYSTEL